MIHHRNTCKECLFLNLIICGGKKKNKNSDQIFFTLGNCQSFSKRQKFSWFQKKKNQICFHFERLIKLQKCSKIYFKKKMLLFNVWYVWFYKFIHLGYFKSINATNFNDIRNVWTEKKNFLFIFFCFFFSFFFFFFFYSFQSVFCKKSCALSIAFNKILRERKKRMDEHS